MHCPQCGKTYPAAQTVCSGCSVQLLKEAPRSSPFGGRLDFAQMSSAPARREPAVVKPVSGHPVSDPQAAHAPSVAPPSRKAALDRQDLPPTARLEAPHEVEPPTAREDEIPTGKLSVPEPPTAREDEIPTGKLAVPPTAREAEPPSRSEAERTAAVAAALMRRTLGVPTEEAPAEPPAPPPPPPRPAAMPSIVEKWEPEKVAPPSGSSKANWVLALLLLPVLALMWFKLVKPLMEAANAPQPALNVPAPITVPSGISPEDTFKGAQARYQKGDFRGAASEANLALTVWERQGADPSQLKEARYFIANAYAEAGEYQQSLTMYRKMLQVEPGNPQLASEAAAVKAKMQKAGRTNAQKTLEQARSQFAGKDYTRAVATARTALMLGQQYGSDKAFQARCSSLIGRGYFKQGRYTEAVSALKQALALNSKDSEARQTLSAARTQLARIQEQAQERAPQQTVRNTTTRPAHDEPDYPTSGYPRSMSSDDNGRMPPPRKGNYNPNYSVPGTKYTPRETGLPDVPAGNSNPGSLPTYDNERNSNLPSYSSGAGENTLPTYSNQGGGVYPGYQSGNKNSSNPPGY